MSHLRFNEKRKRMNKDITFMGKNSIRSDHWAKVLGEKIREQMTETPTNQTIKRYFFNSIYLTLYSKSKYAPKDDQTPSKYNMRSTKSIYSNKNAFDNFTSLNTHVITFGVKRNSHPINDLK